MLPIEDLYFRLVVSERLSRSDSALAFMDYCMYDDEPEPKGRKVRFSNVVTAQDSTISPLSEEECKDMWYSPQELISISQGIKRILHEARKVPCADKYKGIYADNIICYRGLEDSMSHRAVMAFRARKSGVTQAVLLEQQSQRNTAINDPDRIRNKCRIMSRKSKKMAQERAEQDARDAQESSPLQILPSSSLSSKNAELEASPVSKTTVRVDHSRRMIVLDSIDSALLIAESSGIIPIR